MLFSDKKTAEFISENFEPVWQSVRSVPIVRIDFGNGNVITRTLHGNIATYVCTASGQVVDVLPGIYAPDAYRDNLSRMRLLADSLRDLEPSKREEALARYHAGEARLLGRKHPQAVRHQAPDASAVASSALRSEWQALAGDTLMNETVRRRQIHERLATASAVSPELLTRWLYREVLHANLDDPYLGLGDTLFSSYPFTKEDTVN